MNRESWLPVTIEMRERENMRAKRWRWVRSVVHWLRLQIQDAEL